MKISIPNKWYNHFNKTTSEVISLFSFILFFCSTERKSITCVGEYEAVNKTLLLSVSGNKLNRKKIQLHYLFKAYKISLFPHFGEKNGKEKKMVWERFVSVHVTREFRLHHLIFNGENLLTIFLELVFSIVFVCVYE